ncbi:MAG: aspartate aminotransferase family protein [Elusimicrobia bacterium CG_4_9_14_3_um_filter_62_55]|nr:MAG: aspartate aminotransferase family protein [Elusimicrobia bacterium CG22_combo_CG10-13_8_21_14_all_63_91]PJA13917.1 MAG: aspartate aminotransferase family protein [Elusimicrobia bacterium CG_4_10_14_0_2_um_filter_63_34]PJB23816.1 MAG: aspartate aminotransferase family protein [Elusimicrobia bacterium CG_4_9_14_3_um_filter_62_55]
MTITAPEKSPGWIPGPNSQALHNEEQLYMTPGLQQIATFSKIAMKQGRGAVVVDEDGREYLDFIAGVCVASIGHGHPLYAKMIAEQAANISVGSFTTKNRVEFLRRLITKTPQGLDRTQLYSSGAEAVEAALRLAKSYTGHQEVIAFWGGFHGKTGGVLPLLGDSFKHGLGPLMPGIYQSPYPNPYRCPFRTDDPQKSAEIAIDFLKETIRRATAGSLAAIILEPIQGTNGNVIPPAGFIEAVRDVAHAHGALFIADEMITGFGRTGAWFGVDHEGVAPDIMTVGKGIAGGFPVSGIITTKEISDAKPFANPSGSSSSYGGNPLASAACNAALKIVDEENLVENSRTLGAKMLERLKTMKERFPFIGDVRGRGLLIGVEMVKNRASKELLSKEQCRMVFEEALTRGLLTMAYSPVIRINPPLVITEQEAMKGLDLLEETFEAVRPRLGL